MKAWGLEKQLQHAVHGVTVHFFPPPPPVITSPANGTVVSDPLVNVSGSATRNTTVNLYRNGSRVGTPLPVGLPGLFQTTIALTEGNNRLEATTKIGVVKEHSLPPCW